MLRNASALCSSKCTRNRLAARAVSGPERLDWTAPPDPVAAVRRLGPPGGGTGARGRKGGDGRRKEREGRVHNLRKTTPRLSPDGWLRACDSVVGGVCCNQFTFSVAHIGISCLFIKLKWVSIMLSFSTDNPTTNAVCTVLPLYITWRSIQVRCCIVQYVYVFYKELEWFNCLLPLR